MRKEAIRQRLRNIYAEIASRGDQMTDLEEKARGISRVLESATTQPALDRVEAGMLSLQNDLNRASMDFRRPARLTAMF
jgi:hypothetical protein